jgi:transposase-like protein
MKRTTYAAKFKSDRVLEVLSGEETLGAIAHRHNLNPNVLRNWRNEFLTKAPQLFDTNSRTREEDARRRQLESDLEELLKTVGQLTVERDWLKKKSVEVFGTEYEKRFSR